MGSCIIRLFYTLVDFIDDKIKCVFNIDTPLSLLSQVVSIMI